MKFNPCENKFTLKLISSKINLLKVIPTIICNYVFSQFITIVKTIAQKIVKTPNSNEIEEIYIEIDLRNKICFLCFTCKPHKSLIKNHLSILGEQIFISI